MKAQVSGARTAADRLRPHAWSSAIAVASLTDSSIGTGDCDAHALARISANRSALLRLVQLGRLLRCSRDARFGR
jgi:hypothetical protein